MSPETVRIPHLPASLPIYIALYRDVRNVSFLRQQLLSGNTDFEYAFIDASMILSRNHILSAVFRAVNDYLNGRLKSRNVHSEIVYSLSSTTNIADSFRKFGITDTTSSLLVVKVSTTSSVTQESVAAHLEEYIQGSPTPFDDDMFRAISDVAKIKKAYKLGSLVPQPAKNEGANNEDAAKRQLEACLLGSIALRGAA